MSRPKINGIPLYGGKKRTYKKYLSHIYGKKSKMYYRLLDVAAGKFLAVNSIFNSCDCMNHRVVDLQPEGWDNYITDITVVNEVGGCCSFVHCGPDVAWSKEKIMLYINKVNEEYPDNTWNLLEKYKSQSFDEFGNKFE